MSTTSTPPHRLRLWSWHLSPFAAKVRIALAAKQLTDGVALIEVDPLDRPARLKQLNPTGRVPTLELDDGSSIIESTVICEWLEDTHPHPRLLPDDPTARAHARSLTKFVDDELTTPFFLSMRKESFGLEPTDHPELIAHLRARLVKRWRATERILTGRAAPYLSGTDTPTLADLAAIPLAVRLPRWRPDLAPDPHEHPRTAEWLGQLAAHPHASEVRRRGEAPPGARAG